MSRSVFISHSSKDKAIAFDLCDRLEKVGIGCWIAPRDVPPGGSYGVEIIKGISECPVFILIMSENANRSEAVSNEVERAFSYQKTIIPLRIREVMPGQGIEFFVSNAQWVDAFRSPIADRVDYISAVVRASVSGQKIPKPKPERITFGAKSEKFLEQVFRHKALSFVGAFGVVTLMLVALLALQANVKRETSTDPRKELANLGVMWESSNFHNAIARGDEKTIGLFLQGGMPWDFNDIRRVGHESKVQLVNLFVDYKRNQSDAQMNDESCSRFIDGWSYAGQEQGIPLNDGEKIVLKNFCVASTVISAYKTEKDKLQKKYDEDQAEYRKTIAFYNEPGRCVNFMMKENGAAIYNESVRNVSKCMYGSIPECTLLWGPIAYEAHGNPSQTREIVSRYCNTKKSETPPEPSSTELQRINAALLYLKSF